jgi:peptidoglycan/xylan/chitin deacetylase (PgdA/CDA1 family)
VITRLIREVVQRPVQSACRIAQRLTPGAFRNRLTEQARDAGFTEPVFLLSFDCDTERDFEVARDVHARLADLGIKPVYAVPGELLQAGEKTYGWIAGQGAEFINHGHARHCRYNAQARLYESFFFYDQLPEDIVAKDIREGHATLEKVLGRRAQGFRTPHFGTYQARAHIAFLHRVVGELGYRFSSSTVPFAAIRHGVVQGNGLKEIPVSGMFDAPLTILDSWSFRYAPGRKRDAPDYVRQIDAYANFFEKSAPPYVLNLYADPSQVFDWPEFFTAMARLARYNVASFADLLSAQRP